MIGTNDYWLCNLLIIEGEVPRQFPLQQMRYKCGSLVGMQITELGYSSLSE